MVLQKNVLFTGTVKENLNGAMKMPATRLWRPRKGGLRPMLLLWKMKDGYDTDLSQGGVNVSGGQKQRLCIARALLKNRKYPIPSSCCCRSATEAKTGNLSSTTLKEATKIIIIAQRITSVMRQTKLLLLTTGRLSAWGTHGSFLNITKSTRKFNSQKDREVSA